MDYLNAKDIGTQKVVPKFRFLSTEGKHRKKTSYDYWLKHNKGYSLVKEDEEAKTFSAWIDGAFVELDKNTLFGKNDKGKTVLMLDDVYNFECQFAEPTELILKKGKKTVDKFSFEASYSQNKVINDQLEMYGLKKYFIWKKQGQPWFLFEQGDVPEALTKTSTLTEKLTETKEEVKQEEAVVTQETIEDEPTKEDMKDVVVDIITPERFSMKEKAYLVQAKKEGLTDTQLRDFLDGEKLAPDRINELVAEFIE